MTSQVATRCAGLRDPELGTWIAADIAFSYSVVDRITPATKHAERRPY